MMGKKEKEIKETKENNNQQEKEIQLLANENAEMKETVRKQEKEIKEMKENKSQQDKYL